VTHNSSGHILHDLFWQNMSPEGGDEPDQRRLCRPDRGGLRLVRRLEGRVRGGGVRRVRLGALLVYDTFSNQLRNVVVDKHDQGAIWGGHPILALDVWEHPTTTTTARLRGEFVDNFFEVVDWNEPATRYEQAVELFE